MFQEDIQAIVRGKDLQSWQTGPLLNHLEDDYDKLLIFELTKDSLSGLIGKDDIQWDSIRRGLKSQ